MGSLVLIVFIFWGEVAAVAMGLEPEDRGFNRRWMGIGPRLCLLLVDSEVGVEFLKARFLGEIEIAEGNKRLDTDWISRIALDDAIGIGGDFRNLDRRSSAGDSAPGKWPTRVVVRKQKVTVVGDAIANELADGSEEADVETKDGLIGLAGDRMLPANHTDAVVINRAAHIDTNNL